MPGREWMESDRRLVDAAIRRYLPRPGRVPPTVRRAMMYSLFGRKAAPPSPGVEACRVIGGRVSDVLPAAAGLR
jgi:hypothetical protein